VCNTVKKHCPQARVVEKELKARVKCRVIAFNVTKIFFNVFKWIQLLS